MLKRKLDVEITNIIEKYWDNLGKVQSNTLTSKIEEKEEKDEIFILKKRKIEEKLIINIEEEGRENEDFEEESDFEEDYENLEEDLEEEDEEEEDEEEDEEDEEEEYEDEEYKEYDDPK
jgi:hypothetical protein